MEKPPLNWQIAIDLLKSGDMIIHWMNDDGVPRIVSVECTACGHRDQWMICPKCHSGTGNVQITGRTDAP